MVFFISIVIIFIHMSLFWLWYRYTKNPSVVDVGWASGLTINGMLYLYSSPISTRKVILGLVLLLWGLRLGGYLWYTRIRRNEVDKRYIQLSEPWEMSKSLGFFLNFQFQGFLILMIAIPWYFISQTPAGRDMCVLDYCLISIALLSIAAESIADYQLQSFKALHPGSVCNVGLWYYSRHPNYFFEWLTWCVYASLSLSDPYGWMAWISPLLLLLIMVRVTAPLTEKGSIQSRGEPYIQYQKLTPMFFPNFFKKNVK